MFPHELGPWHDYVLLLRLVGAVGYGLFVLADNRACKTGGSLPSCVVSTFLQARGP